MDLTIKFFENIKDLSEIQDALDIRLKVFVLEQNVKEEVDEYEMTSAHIVLYSENKPVANCRIVYLADKVKIGRVAVLSEYRGKKLGERITKEALNYLINQGKEKVYISAQLYVKKFYEKLGFIQTSDVYMEENIEHVAMICELKDRELYKLD